MSYPTDIGLGFGQSENLLLHDILNRVGEAVLYWKTVRDENKEIFGFSLSYANKKAQSLVPFNVGTKLIPAHTPNLDWDFLNMLTEVVGMGTVVSNLREYVGKNGPVRLSEKAWKEGDGVLLLLEVPAHHYDRAIAPNPAEQNKGFTAIADASPAFIWKSNPEGEGLFMSRSWHDYTGLGSSDAQSKDWRSAIHPADLAQVNERWEKAANRGTNFEGQLRYRRKDGLYRWHQVRAVAERNDYGEITAWYGIAIDIDDMKSAMDTITESEKKLRESQARLAAEGKESASHFTSIFTTAEVGISEISLQGRFLRVNDALCSILDRKRDELLTVGINEVTDAKYLARTLEAVQRLIATGYPQTLDKQYTRPDGTTVWANSTLSLLKVKENDEPTILAVTVDLTERYLHDDAIRRVEEHYRVQLKEEVRQRTAELEENRKLLQGTLDSAIDMIQVFEAVRDENGEIIDFIWVLNNNTAERIYGDVIGKSLLQLNPGVVETGIFRSFIEVTETGIPQQYEKRYAHEQFDGWFFQSVVKLNDGVASSTANITERKKAEQEVAALNRRLMNKNRQLESLNSELKTFNSIAANDYNETFRSLYLHLENIIKNEAATMTDSGKGSVRKAQAAINKMKLLTEDIVAYSRIPQMDNTLARVSLEDVLQGALQGLEEKVKESGTVAESVQLPVIEGYPLLLSLLFHHLLDNAIKFRQPDRSLKITVRAERVAKQDMPYHQITIADNGIGFDNSEAENIFNIFYRLHERHRYRGSGVGLAVCKKIMHLHGGYITAEGREGKGAIMCCLFPADA